MSYVRLLEDVAVMMSTNTHLKGVVDFREVLDISFLFIVDIWHDVQNGLGYTLSSMSCQKMEASTASSDIVDRCPNLWYNNSK